MRFQSLAALFCSAACAGSPASSPSPKNEPAPPMSAQEELTAFLDHQVELLKPLSLEANRAWFDATVTGTDESFARSQAADQALNRFLADPQRFAEVVSWREKGKGTDPLLQRQVEVLYRSMLGKQVDPALLDRITALEKEVEQAFNVYRGKVNDKSVSQNEINDILRTSVDSRLLQQAWEAQKGVGPLVAPKLKELVFLRNEVAQKLGFANYYGLRIAESEQDEQALLRLFDALDELTREPFLKAKAQVDARLAKRLRIKPAQLMPWHYQNAFFQEPPAVFDTGLDKAFQGRDPLVLCRAFYKGIGLDVEGIIGRSDLYEKKGKTPHAFAADIDREGDVRVIANVVPGSEWQATMMHELGHAVYDEGLARSLPWLLREASHPLTTEGIAMMFEDLASNPLWAEQMGVIDAAQRERVLSEAQAEQSFAALLFSRWTQVMLRFERAMYSDPNQDLDALWWSLVEQYQGLKRPANRSAPDYASKIHLVIVPVYYHNYMMGSLFAAQVHESIDAALGTTDPFSTVFTNEPRVGAFLKERIFSVGARYRWDELTLQMTGRELTPDAFARRFVAQ